jgi:hypothetical protein
MQRRLVKRLLAFGFALGYVDYCGFGGTVAVP